MEDLIKSKMNHWTVLWFKMMSMPHQKASSMVKETWGKSDIKYAFVTSTSKLTDNPHFIFDRARDNSSL